MRLIRCLLYGFVDYCGKGTKSFNDLTGHQDLEVHTATYGPEIDQSQHEKSFNHIIKAYTNAVMLVFQSLGYNQPRSQGISLANLDKLTGSKNTLYSLAVALVGKKEI